MAEMEPEAPSTPAKPWSKKGSFESPSSWLSPSGVPSPSVPATPPSIKRQASLLKMFKDQGATTELQETTFKHKPVSPEPLIHLSEFKPAWKQVPRDAVERSFREAELKRKAKGEDKEARKKAALAIQEASKSGLAVDPSLDAKWQATRIGRPETEKGQTEYEKRQKAREQQGLTKKGANSRMLGAPVLRRDPSAAEKIAMVNHVERACKKDGCTIKELPSTFKRSIEAFS